MYSTFFFFQAEAGIRDADVTGVQTCALPISTRPAYCTQAGSRLPRVLSDEFDELALAALARLHLPTDLLDQRQHLVHGVADRHHHSPALGELLEERRWHGGGARRGTASGRTAPRPATPRARSLPVA